MMRFSYFFLFLGIFTFQAWDISASCHSSFFNEGPAYSLFQQAMKARDNAHAPYSQFFVGAAVLTESGKVYCGCNMENASYTSTLCAETVAIGKMNSEGDKVIKELVVVGDSSKAGGAVSPCGNCRQVIAEFSADPNIPVHLYDPKEGYKATHTIGELLPHSFSFSKKKTSPAPVSAPDNIPIERKHWKIPISDDIPI